MYAKLGNITFDGLKGFDSFSSAGDEANYAEFELINGKPRLQKVGQGLRELNISINFHAKFCKPDEQVQALQTACADGEVLPLLFGNGEYLGDFVVIAAPYTVIEAFSNGTSIQIVVDLTLKEFISFSGLEQKQRDARKKAFALGPKTSVGLVFPQPAPPKFQLSTSLIAAQQQAKRVDSLTGDFENNVSARAAVAKKIQQACIKGKASLDQFNSVLNDTQELQAKFTSLKGVATSVITAFDVVKDRFPFNDLQDLKSGNTSLQGVLRTFNTASIPLLTDVIIRR